MDPDSRGGRPKTVTPEQRDAVVAVAGARPDTQGVALTRWSIDKLAQHLVEQQIAWLSPTVLRALLEAAGDEGAGRAPVGRPERHRATCNRKRATRYSLGAYDVHADHLMGRLRAHKSALDVLDFLQTIRMRYPARRRVHLGATRRRAACRLWPTAPAGARREHQPPVDMRVQETGRTTGLTHGIVDLIDYDSGHNGSHADRWIDGDGADVSAGGDSGAAYLERSSDCTGGSRQGRRRPPDPRRPSTAFA